MQISATTVLGLAFGGAFVLLAGTSSWLRGRLWFAATVGTLAAALVLLEIGSSTAATAAGAWLEFCGLALVFAVFFYLLSSRHLTGTAIVDTTYQSHEALVAFLDEQRNSSSLAAFTRRLGPLLLLALVAYAAFAAWAKFTGRVG